MAFYLNVCRDEKRKDFLLISEQTLDAVLPEIKAQVYFEAPVANLKKCEIYGTTYAICKKEVEIILNLAQKRESHGFRSFGLFAEGKVDKKDPFNVFSYPSVQDLQTILEALNLDIPKEELYLRREVAPDKEHILDNKHHIAWEHHLELNNREHADLTKWTDIELVEAKILNWMNLVELIVELYESSENQKKQVIKLDKKLLADIDLLRNDFMTVCTRQTKIKEEILQGLAPAGDLRNFVEYNYPDLYHKLERIINTLEQVPV